CGIGGLHFEKGVSLAVLRELNSDELSVDSDDCVKIIDLSFHELGRAPLVLLVGLAKLSGDQFIAFFVGRGCDSWNEVWKIVRAEGHVRVDP
ncbi:MAG: hypothetical protein IID33_13180, partial [Planctomycetes bacterium]|nr:hypothetical protein [Planctomycetota bacterium]